MMTSMTLRTLPHLVIPIEVASFKNDCIGENTDTLPQVTDSCTYKYSLDISNDRYDSEIALKYDMLGDQTNLPTRHVPVDLLYSEI